jgi:hypothetical protein
LLKDGHRECFFGCDEVTRCELVTVCSCEEFESLPPTPTSDRICQRKSMFSTMYDSTKYVLDVGTNMNDSTLADMKDCGTCEYQSQQASTTQNCGKTLKTSDRQCSGVEACEDGEWEIQPPTSMSNRLCGPVPICTEHSGAGWPTKSIETTAAGGPLAGGGWRIRDILQDDTGQCNQKPFMLAVPEAVAAAQLYSELAVKRTQAQLVGANQLCTCRKTCNTPITGHAQSVSDGDESTDRECQCLADYFTVSTGSFAGTGRLQNCEYACSACSKCDVISSHTANTVLATQYIGTPCSEEVDTTCLALKTPCFEQSFAEIRAALDALTTEGTRTTWETKTWEVAGKGKTCKQDPANAASPANQVACENRFITSSAACVGTLGGDTCVWTVIAPRTDSTLVGGSTSLIPPTTFLVLPPGFSSCTAKVDADAVACNSAGTDTECLAVKTVAGVAGACTFQARQSSYSFLYFEHVTATDTTDRQCQPKQICQTDEYESDPGTATTDRTCRKLRVCNPALEYELHALAEHPYVRLIHQTVMYTEDRQCQELHVCECTQFEEKIGTCVETAAFPNSDAANKARCDAIDNLNLDDPAACAAVADAQAAPLCTWTPSSKLVPLTVLRTSDRTCTPLRKCKILCTAKVAADVVACEAADTETVCLSVQTVAGAPGACTFTAMEYESRYPLKEVLDISALPGHSLSVLGQVQTVSLYRGDRDCAPFSFGPGQTKCADGVEYSSDETVECTLDPVVLSTRSHEYVATVDTADPKTFNFVGGNALGGIERGEDTLAADDNWYPDVSEVTGEKTVVVTVSYPADDAVNGCRDFADFVDTDGNGCGWWAANTCNATVTTSTASADEILDRFRAGLTPRRACCACGGGSATEVKIADFTVSAVPFRTDGTAEQVIQNVREASRQARSGTRVHQTLLVTAFAKPANWELMAGYPRTYINHADWDAEGCCAGTAEGFEHSCADARDGKGACSSGADDVAVGRSTRGGFDPNPGFHATVAVYTSHSEDWCYAQRVDTCTFDVYVFDDEPPTMTCPEELHVCTDGGRDSDSMYATVYTDVFRGLDDADIRDRSRLPEPVSHYSVPDACVPITAMSTCTAIPDMVPAGTATCADVTALDTKDACLGIVTGVDTEACAYTQPMAPTCTKTPAAFVGGVSVDGSCTVAAGSGSCQYVPPVVAGMFVPTPSQCDDCNCANSDCPDTYRLGVQGAGFFPQIADNVDGRAPGYETSIVVCALDNGASGCRGTVAVEPFYSFSPRTLTQNVAAYRNGEHPGCPPGTDCRVAGISQAEKAELTFAGGATARHNFQPGDVVSLDGNIGMTRANQKTCTVEKLPIVVFVITGATITVETADSLNLAKIKQGDSLVLYKSVWDDPELELPALNCLVESILDTKITCTQQLDTKGQTNYKTRSAKIVFADKITCAQLDSRLWPAWQPGGNPVAILMERPGTPVPAWPPVVTGRRPPEFLIGRHTVRWTASDSFDNREACQSTLVVHDCACPKFTFNFGGASGAVSCADAAASAYEASTAPGQCYGNVVNLGLSVTAVDNSGVPPKVKLSVVSAGVEQLIDDDYKFPIGDTTVSVMAWDLSAMTNVQKRWPDAYNYPGTGSPDFYPRINGTKCLHDSPQSTCQYWTEPRNESPCSCTFIVRIKDEEPPVVCPSGLLDDVVISESEAEAVGGFAAYGRGVVFAAPTSTDNSGCVGTPQYFMVGTDLCATRTEIVGGSVAEATPFPVGVTTPVTGVWQDCAGNTQECQFNVVIRGTWAKATSFEHAVANTCRGDGTIPQTCFGPESATAAAGGVPLTAPAGAVLNFAASAGSVDSLGHATRWVRSPTVQGAESSDNRGAFLDQTEDFDCDTVGVVAYPSDVAGAPACIRTAPATCDGVSTAQPKSKCVAVGGMGGIYVKTVPAGCGLNLDGVQPYGCRVDSQNSRVVDACAEATTRQSCVGINVDKDNHPAPDCTWMGYAEPPAVVAGADLMDTGRPDPATPAENWRQRGDTYFAMEDPDGAYFVDLDRVVVPSSAALPVFTHAYFTGQDGVLSFTVTTLFSCAESVGSSTNVTTRTEYRLGGGPGVGGPGVAGQGLAGRLAPGGPQSRAGACYQAAQGIPPANTWTPHPAGACAGGDFATEAQCTRDDAGGTLHTWTPNTAVCDDVPQNAVPWGALPWDATTACKTWADDDADHFVVEKVDENPKDGMHDDINADDIVAGATYRIREVITQKFTEIGATDNKPGTVFVANAAWLHNTGGNDKVQEIDSAAVRANRDTLEECLQIEKPPTYWTPEPVFYPDATCDTPKVRGAVGADAYLDDQRKCELLVNNGKRQAGVKHPLAAHYPGSQPDRKMCEDGGCVYTFASGVWREFELELQPRKVCLAAGCKYDTTGDKCEPEDASSAVDCAADVATDAYPTEAQVTFGLESSMATAMANVDTVSIGQKGCMNPDAVDYRVNAILQDTDCDLSSCCMDLTKANGDALCPAGRHDASTCIAHTAGSGKAYVELKDDIGKADRVLSDVEKSVQSIKTMLGAT